ncbi:MAG: hypothetical protein KDH88_00945 [Chromatiales bacterium]|nr:hypothetical protein [Chromatiales bacterium]
MNIIYLAVFIVFSLTAGNQLLAAPVLVNPALGSLSLLTHDTTALRRVDGLTFDAHGNLFAALEVTNSNGGIAYVDIDTGAVTQIVTGVSGVDQIDLHPSGALHITREFGPEQTTGRLLRVDLDYDANQIPVAAAVTDITTSPNGLDNVEGLVTLQQDSAYGSAGDLIVGEDLVNGRILHIALNGDDGATAVLVDTGVALQRPEGMAFGGFGADLALYVAETLNNRILRMEPDGSLSVFGLPGGSLVRPDNLEFGPDGYLYAAEDPASGTGRILRYDAAGNEEIVATGFSKASGLAFDPLSGDLFIGEQNEANLWRLSFTSPTSVPIPPTILLLLTFLPLLSRSNRG